MTATDSAVLWTDDWSARTLDLEGYLARIGYTGPALADVQTLTAIHRAHVAHIPFENLGIMLGRGASLDLDDIQKKIVGQRRGGYCYEMNLLFAAALERLGFVVRRQLIRTQDPLVSPRPRGHLATLVDIGGSTWLADVGFGSGLLEPVPMEQRGTFGQGGWEFRMTGPGPDGGIRVHNRHGQEWVTMFTVSTESTYRVDIEVANENTSTSPGSPFTKRPIVVQRFLERELRLIGRDLTVVRAEGGSTTSVMTDAEYGATLKEMFGISLSQPELATVLAAIPVSVTDEEGD